MWKIGNYEEYKGYTGSVEYNEDEYFGRINDIEDIVEYSADSAENLFIAFRKTVDEYMEFLAEKKNEKE